MKRFIVLMLSVFSFLVVSAVHASETIGFEWNANDPPIDGYRLYMDIGAAPLLEISPDVQTIRIEKPVDGKKHNYWITAFLGENESGASNVETWAPLRTVKVSGFLIIEE